ncbi:UBP1-associated proteins 1C-like [Quillaja saponaria]|uniref:UBP1-associated proteins 1C-like n=1 Tax=Quillaja saponaria TaxID=32244 RepID=A0AAD7PHM1_QUISA|nr:UBP1-associated proteins 1C-like [Quillaja saponaria]
MVWFQCEDCGDNLKKPKLLNHFRTCSARKLSCIDCGEIFGRDTVQDHTQCITEAEKYGPKGQPKALNATTAKPNKNSKQHPVVDINVGLSERAPWFCSLCNTKTTSRQTLLLHAEGKKHKAKAKGFHAAKQQPIKKDESAPDAESPTGNTPKRELVNNKHVGQPKLQERLKMGSVYNDLDSENGTLPSTKKRKFDAFENVSLMNKSRDNSSDEVGNGEVVQGERAEGNNGEIISKKDKLVESAYKIKWKKLIKSALKSHPDGALKMRKLKKLVLKALQESGTTKDETQLSDILEQKINSNSRFAVEGKYVCLVAKD